MFGMKNKSMPCEQNREKISALLDDEVSPKEKVMIEKHLSLCTKCRTLEEWLRCIKEGVAKSARNIGISDGARDKILDLLRQIPPEAPPAPWWKRMLKRN